MSESQPELWEFSGPTWRLPIVVRHTGDWPEECVKISLPQMPWLNAQRKLVVEFVSSLSVRKDDCGWILKAESLSSSFQKSLHTNPQDIVAWNWTDATALGSSHFITAYCKHPASIIKDKVQATMIWASFCRFALNWLTHHNRVLDLGFASICPLPVRANWLTMLEKNHRNASKLAGFDMHEFIRIQAARSEITGFDEKSGTIKWTLTAVANERFHEATRKIELQCKSNGRNYALHVRKFIHDQSKRIYEIFEAYLAEAAAPFLGVPRLRFSRPPKRWKNPFAEPVAQNSERADGDLHGGNDVDRVLEARDAASLEGQNASVHEVPDLQSRIARMRNSRPDMDRSFDGKAGSNGMPLLSPVEKQTGSELLAVGETSGDYANGALAEATELLSAEAHKK